jgi:hypothetical protein
MGLAYHWRPGDRRSRRADRVPVDMRVLGRILPITPLRIEEQLPEAMPLRQLHELLELAGECIGRHVPELRGALPLSNGHYSELLGVLFGGTQRELLAPGTYVITDSSPSQRVLYVGSTVDGVMRSRLISHIYEEGRVHLSQQAYRDVVAAIQAKTFEDEDTAELALRYALFGANRCAVANRHRSHLAEKAVGLLSYGAFDVAAVKLPRGYTVVARCLERYLVDAHLRRTSDLPPLNSWRVNVDLRGNTGSLDAQALLALVAALDKLAFCGD